MYKKATTSRLKTREMSILSIGTNIHCVLLQKCCVAKPNFQTFAKNMGAQNTTFIILQIFRTLDTDPGAMHQLPALMLEALGEDRQAPSPTKSAQKQKNCKTPILTKTALLSTA